jgi:membrane fusion protein (multidrug efflux system)
MRKVILFILGLFIIFVVIAGVYALQIGKLIAAGKEFAKNGPPPEAVTTAQSREELWEPTINAVGSLTAVQGVTVSTETPGKVVKISFEAGSTVKEGDLLLQLDTSLEEALLRSAEANAALVRLNFQRAKDLRAHNANSQSELDTAEAQAKQADAQADNIRAAIGKKMIKAPFSGRLGIRLVNLGQTLNAGDGIVSLQALDPIYADFMLPQQYLAQIAVNQSVRLKSDALPDKMIEGKVTAINPEVDAATRNFRVQATFSNPGEELHPGMFTSVDVVLPSKEKVIVIPATSVLHSTFLDTVFVVEEVPNKDTGKTEKTVRQQSVRLGERRGDFVAVSSGIKPGETVVSSGAFKLRNGSKVTVDNTLAPDAQLAPKPNDT